MINDIKIDGLIHQLTPKKAKVEVDSQATAPKRETVTVSNKLSAVVNAMVAEESAVSDDARVAQMKHRVQTGDYVIDTDALSEKLMHNVFFGG